MENQSTEALRVVQDAKGLWIVGAYSDKLTKVENEHLFPTHSSLGTLVA